MALHAKSEPGRYSGVSPDATISSPDSSAGTRRPGDPSFRRRPNGGLRRSGPFPRRAPSTIGGVYDELLAARPGASAGSLRRAVLGHRHARRLLETPGSFGRLMDRPTPPVPGRGRHRSRARVNRSICGTMWRSASEGPIHECIVTDGVTCRAGALAARLCCADGEAPRDTTAAVAVTAATTSGHGPKRAPTPRADRSVPGGNGLRRARGVVPLTGDASDRRYFRVIRRDGPSMVLRCTPGRSTSVAAVRQRRASCSADAGAGAAILGTLGSGRHHGAQDLGDVTLQAHLGAASPTEQRRSIVRRSRSSSCCSGAARSSRPDGICRTASRSTSRSSLGAGLLRQALRRGLPGTALSQSHEPRSPRVQASSRELAAEPRVLCHRDYHSRNLMLHDGRLLHHRLPGRADGPRHLRSGVAAARFVRRFRRSRGRRTDRVFPGAEGRQPATRANSAGASI